MPSGQLKARIGRRRCLGGTFGRAVVDSTLLIPFCLAFPILLLGNRVIGHQLQLAGGCPLGMATSGSMPAVPRRIVQPVSRS